MLNRREFELNYIVDRCITYGDKFNLKNCLVSSIYKIFNVPFKNSKNIIFLNTSVSFNFIHS